MKSDDGDDIITEIRMNKIYMTLSSSIIENLMIKYLRLFIRKLEKKEYDTYYTRDKLSMGDVESQIVKWVIIEIDQF